MSIKKDKIIGWLIVSFCFVFMFFKELGCSKKKLVLVLGLGLFQIHFFIVFITFLGAISLLQNFSLFPIQLIEELAH